MEGVKKGEENYLDYFKPLAYGDVETENLTEENVDKEKGTAVYKRVDSSKDAIVRYRITPRTNLTYYFFVPASLNSEKDYSVLLNGKWFTHSKRNTQRQLWQITDNAENQESVLEFRFKTDKVDLSNAGVYRAEISQIQSAIEKRKEQGLQVEKFSNTHIVGSVNITDDSKYMMTSIPYSEGWKVKVDGKDVPVTKAWNSFISFPITSGQHKIEFVFSQKGRVTGAVLTLISLTTLYIVRRDYKKDDKKQLKESQDTPSAE